MNATAPRTFRPENRLTRLGLLTEPAGYVDGVNLYQYVGSNSPNQVDPLGLEGAATQPSRQPATQPTTQPTPAETAQENRLWDRSGFEVLTGHYLDFWEGWLGLADANRKPLDVGCKSRMRCMLRAIIWVESKHGTAGLNQPGRDPMQVGNPRDQAWPHITNQPNLLPGKELDPRPVRQGKLPGVTWPNLPGTVGKDPTRPATINPNLLPANGHDSPQFTPNMSIFWGTLWWLQKMNQGGGANTQAWNCKNCSWEHLINGAVNYNGAGNPNYKQEIEQALRLSGCKS